MNTTATTDVCADRVVDLATINERFEGDWQLVCEVAGLFLEDCPRRVTAVHNALAAGDCEALQRAAHSLKGSMSNFAAADATQAALRLEMIARGGDLKEAPAAIVTLEREIARLTPVLVRLIQESGSQKDHARPNC